MCYVLLLSTSSAADLSAESTPLVRFEKPADDETLAQSLHHSYKWYVGSSTGCSCTFRHVMSREMGFGKPEDWSPEQAEEIAATGAFIAVVRKLLDAGHQVDCLNFWNGAGAGEITKLDVDLSIIADNEFRFFENYHFCFVNSPGT